MSKKSYPACGCAAEKISDKQIRIEYLYLDLKTCERCIGTDEVLEQVVETLRPGLELAGYEVIYEKQEMATAELAEQYRFLSSPTIRVNGRDIMGTVLETGCSCCSDIAGVTVDCRVFEYEGKNYEVPTKEMLAEAILKSLNTPDSQSGCACGTYELPENLKRFYEGKEKKTENKPSCGCSSCNEAGDSSLSIKVLGAGCKSCHELYENTKKAVKNAGLSVEVEYITDLEKVMGYGVMSMPGLVVNEKVVSMGKVLKTAEVEKALHKLGY